MRVLFGDADGSETFATRRVATSVHTSEPIPSIEVLAMVEQAGQRYAFHPAIRRAGFSANEWNSLFRALVQIESAYDPRARSHVGAYGLGQLMPGTADYLGVDRYDPVQNLDGAVRYFLEMLDMFGTPRLAVAAYNAGPDAVRRYGGIPPFRETQGHVRKVMAAYTRLIQTEGLRP